MNDLMDSNAQGTVRSERAISSIIYNRVSSEADRHFIDRRYLTGVPEAAAEIAALYAAPPEQFAKNANSSAQGTAELSRVANWLDDHARIATNSLHCGDNSQTIQRTHKWVAELEAAARLLRQSSPLFGQQEPAQREDSTCYVERSKVREILIGQPDESLHITELVLRDIDALPIFTAAERERSATSSDGSGRNRIPASIEPQASASRRSQELSGEAGVASGPSEATRRCGQTSAAMRDALKAIVTVGSKITDPKNSYGIHMTNIASSALNSSAHIPGESVEKRMTADERWCLANNISYNDPTMVSPPRETEGER